MRFTAFLYDENWVRRVWTVAIGGMVRSTEPLNCLGKDDLNQMRKPSRPLGVAEGWPCQRLRVGYGLVLFALIELLLLGKLPTVLPFMMLGLGSACLISAWSAVRAWRLETQLAMIKDALSKLAGEV